MLQTRNPAAVIVRPLQEFVQTETAGGMLLLAAGMVAGVGFTVSLFITNPAFADGALIDEAKIGILAGSALIGAIGLVALRFVFPAPSRARGNGREAS
jgi:Na+/H+ antiporter NhaA